MSDGAILAAPVGLLGGTFDPVHHGHLRLAIEMFERLSLAEVRFVPLHAPPHRAVPIASGGVRREMLAAAVKDAPGLVVDDCELRRGGVSYTIETLTELRESLGARPICLILGMDAFASLPSWREWRRIIDLAHIAVARRPGTAFPRDAELSALLDAHRMEHPRDLLRSPAGGLVLESFPLLDISSSRIREIVRVGGTPRFLLPDAVIEIINGRSLYR